MKRTRTGKRKYRRYTDRQKSIYWKNKYLNLSMPKRLLNYRGQFKTTDTTYITDNKIVSDRIRVKLPYREVGYNSNNSSATGGATLRGNGAYDPDVKLANIYPSGYIQYAYFFRRYRVLSSYLKVTLCRSTEACRIIILPSILSQPPNYTDALQNPLHKELVIPTTLVQRYSLSHWISSAKIFGVSTLGEDELYSSTIETFPQRQWYWHIYVISYNGTSAITAHIDIQLIYDIEFYQRAIMAPGESGVEGSIPPDPEEPPVAP